MTHDLEWFKSREQEYRAWLRLIVLDKDKSYREFENEKIAGNKPIRNPKGHKADVHDREWFWRDAFWCQDFGLDEGAEFFGDLNMANGLTEEEAEEILGNGGGCEDGIFDFFVNTTNAVFSKVFPDLAHILEG